MKDGETEPLKREQKNTVCVPSGPSPVSRTKQREMPDKETRAEEKGENERSTDRVTQCTD